MKRHQQITEKLISSDLKVNKTRNAFIILAIFLTTFLLSATFSIGVNFYENMRMEQFRQYGTMCNGAVTYPTEKQVERLKELDYIDKVSLMVPVGNAVSSEQTDGMRFEMWYADEIEWRVMRSPTYTDIYGTYPEKEDEVMLSSRTLEKLGIISPSIGMEFPLKYENSSGQETRKKFRLSGWYIEYAVGAVSAGVSDFGLAYVSEALCNQLGQTVEKDGIAHFTVTEPSQLPAFIQALESDLQPSEDQEIKATGMFIDDKYQKLSIAGFVAILVIIFILSGFLIINNVLYISLCRDIQYYGRLKALGATQRQIRSIVLGQVLY